MSQPSEPPLWPARPDRWAWGSVIVTALAAAGLIGLLGWRVARATPLLEVTATTRLVAFSFAVMVLCWLTATFLLAGRFTPTGLLRWAVVVDSVGVALVIGAMVSGVAGWREGVKLYLVLACFAAMQLGAVWLMCRLGAPSGSAVGTAVALAVLGCSSLVWGHLPIGLFAPASRGEKAVLAVVRYSNPLLAADDAISPATQFDWPHHGRMYHPYSIIGQDRLWPLPSWWAACLIYAAIASALLLAGAAVRPRPGDEPTPGR